MCHIVYRIGWTKIREEKKQSQRYLPLLTKVSINVRRYFNWNRIKLMDFCRALINRRSHLITFTFLNCERNRIGQRIEIYRTFESMWTSIKKNRLKHIFFCVTEQQLTNYRSRKWLETNELTSFRGLLFPSILLLCNWPFKWSLFKRTYSNELWISSTCASQSLPLMNERINDDIDWL